MGVIDGLLLLVAAFLAGALNAVAGGGSFLTLPALIYAGVPPVAANATSTMALLPGYLSGAYGFRREITAVGSQSVVGMLGLSLVGGLLGALLLLVTPNEVFRGIVPWLLLAATLLFALGNRLTLWLHRHATHGRGPMIAGLLAVSIYGGYFNGGLGIMLLALFCLVGMTNLHAMNGLKSLISAVLTVVSATAFAVAGIIHWREALFMMAATTAGGYGGARLARRIKPAYLRAGIVAVGLIMTVLFLAA